MYVLSIDVGTSNTVGMVRDSAGRVGPLLFDGSPLLPSAVYLGTDGVLLVGRDAQHQARLDPRRFEPHPKRRVGHGRIRLGGRGLAVTGVIAEVIAHVARESSRMLGSHPAEVRLTHPVRWRGRRQAKVLPEAARAAGLTGPIGVRLVAVRRALLDAGVDGISERDIDSLDDLLDMLDRGSTGLLHFACHNGYSVESGGSFIRMAGGNFVPALLNSVRTDATLARTSPLIFLNACRSAGIAPYYTRMMGWAEQFMSAGAGAFVGTLWPVETRRAASFAEAFYASLLGGETLGVAGLTARRAIEDPADPSWLAYTIYGNPNAVATLGK